MLTFVADNTRSSEVKALYERMGISKTKLADRLGVKASDLNNWVHGTSNKVPDDVLAKVRTMNLVASGNARQTSVSYGVLAPIPVVGRVSAGFGHSNVDADQMVAYVPANLANEVTQAYIIDGISMEPALEHGDTCIFRMEPDLVSGLCFVFKNRDGEFFCKYITKKNGRYVGSSFNEDFEDMDLEDCEILGFLVGVYRVIGSYEYLAANFNGLKRKNSGIF